MTKKKRRSASQTSDRPHTDRLDPSIKVGDIAHATGVAIGTGASVTVINQAPVISEPKLLFLVPFPHNPDFVGRETELTSLHEVLQQGQSIVGIRPTVLVGLGGIGKTQLAVEYAHAYRDDYPSGVFWLNAINPLLIEFSDLAEKLEMADRETPRDKAARKVWDYLDSHPDTLVIFDNVLEPSELNVPFSPDLIPANLRCRTLFTTRQRDFPRTFHSFEVKVLPEMAAMRLLLRARAEVLEEHHPEWGLARIVCASLGWLPLALELSAAYLGTYPEVTIEGYLERLRMEGYLKTVDDTELCPADLPTRHDIAVRATLQTQWARLDDEDARLVFNVAGQFSEASWIPTVRLGLLTGIEADAKPGYPAPLTRALKKLHAVSLIEELIDDRLRLHPLVQVFAAQLSLPDFRPNLATRVAVAFEDLLYLQARIARYGIDLVLEDVRIGLNFCANQVESVAYSRLFSLKRVLDRQAHYLRGWDPQTQPVFLLQQLRNESLELDLSDLRARAEAELIKLGQPYLCEQFKVNRESPELLRTLQGHSADVWGVALNADGRLAISASADQTLKMWEVATGRELRTFQGHGAEVYDVALSADGHLAISASADKTLKVWDVTTGRELRTLKGHSSSVNSVALSANGHLAISASADKTLKAWDVTTGRELRTFQGHGAEVYDVALSADGQVAISASADKTLKVWDVTTGRELRTLVGHSATIWSVALSADGQLAISASWDKTLKVWEVATGHELRTLQGHSDMVRGVALSADGRIAVSASHDQTLKVWEIATGRELHTFRGHSEMARDVAVSADGRLAISGSHDQTLKVWGMVTYSQLCTPQGHSMGVNGVAVSADGRLAVSASDDQTLKVWEVATGCELRTLQGHGAEVYDVALSTDGRLAVSASRDKTLRVWEVATGRELRMLQGHSESVHGVALSADGRLAVSASWDTTLRVWEVATGRELRTLHHVEFMDVNSVALSADGRLAVSAAENYAFPPSATLRVWEVATGRELHTFQEYNHGVYDVALSADGRLAISASRDKTLRMWEVATGRELRTFHGHRDIVYRVTLSADTKLAVSTSQDDTLRVWEVATGQIVSMLATTTRFTCCAITADRRTIIAGDSVGAVHFLEWVGEGEVKAPEVV